MPSIGSTPGLVTTGPPARIIRRDSNRRSEAVTAAGMLRDPAVRPRCTRASPSLRSPHDAEGRAPWRERSEAGRHDREVFARCIDNRDRFDRSFFTEWIRTAGPLPCGRAVRHGAIEVRTRSDDLPGGRASVRAGRGRWLGCGLVLPDSGPRGRPAGKRLASSPPGTMVGWMGRDKGGILARGRRIDENRSGGVGPARRWPGGCGVIPPVRRLWRAGACGLVISTGSIIPFGCTPLPDDEPIDAVLSARSVRLGRG
jgi:hypothetical protein